MELLLVLLPVVYAGSKPNRIQPPGRMPINKEKSSKNYPGDGATLQTTNPESTNDCAWLHRMQSTLRIWSVLWS